MRGFWQRIGLRRRVSVVIPVNLNQATANLSATLQNDIQLSGQWQLTRQYWGHLSQQQLTLHGPKAQRQFCFLSRGLLKQGNTDAETYLDLEITLGKNSSAQLWGTILTLFVLLPLVLRWYGVLVLPFFLAFLYAMTQWHFACYANEISQLLCDQAMGEQSSSADP